MIPNIRRTRWRGGILKLCALCALCACVFVALGGARARASDSGMGNTAAIASRRTGGELRLIPGGQLVGVAVKCSGLIYVGASDLGQRPSPARMAGLKGGDVIVYVDGEATGGVQEFSNTISSGRGVTLTVMRDNSVLLVPIKPEIDPRDNEYRIGAWVRESAAGVGTLTYIDPFTGVYGALGHAIQDPDTLIIVPVGSGAIYDSDVTGIARGEKGAPGALTGDFVDRNQILGTIEANTQAGIFGVFTRADALSQLFPGGLPVARASEVREGEAQILCTLDEEGPTLFSCALTRVDAQAATSLRGLTVKITDDKLLSKTGGIVQGMSGSPIIQNGKLVGAVTHVLVNDPTRGYGITMEKMLSEAAGTAAEVKDAA